MDGNPRDRAGGWKNTRLSDEEIKRTYDLIKKYHAQYLKDFGVILPNLKWNGKYTKDALVLVYLAQDYPNTHIVSKTELTEFINQYFPGTNDVQQARHLAAQKGWFILSGTRNDNASMRIPKGSYKLKALDEHYPGFTAERRSISADDDYWENLKKQYEYRCASCGSKEGEVHRYWKNRIVTLHKGHKDPSKPLKEGNIIPQCDSCNRPDRNYWRYDDKGRVVGIANEKVVDTCNEKLKKAIYTRLRAYFEDKKSENES